MNLLSRTALVSNVIFAGLLLVGPLRPVFADSPGSSAGKLAIHLAAKPVPPEVSPPSEHPLLAVLRYARKEQAYLHANVRDFTCRLVKRERIGGILQDLQYIDIKAREEVRSGGQVVEPMAIYLQFVGPAKVAGRRVVYVAGRNNGKMLVRNGGKHFEYVVVEIDPDGESARDESLVPITQSGFTNVLNQMIGVLERHVKADVSAANTHVERIAGAKINHRACTLIRIVHPQKQEGLEFHQANVFVDDELHVPVRVDFSSWPTRPNQTPPLLAEYTYTELKLNVNLSDSDFDASLVRRSSR